MNTPDSSRQTARPWLRLVVASVLLATVFAGLFGPYFVREAVVRRLEARGTLVAFLPDKDGWLSWLRTVPGFRHIGLRAILVSNNPQRPIAEGDYSGILTDARLLDAPISLDLSDSRSLDRDLAQLESASRLKLTVTNRPLSDESIRQMSQITGMIELQLAGCTFSDSALRDFRQLQQLRSLELDGTSITDEGLQHLQTLRSLGSLSLSNTQVSELAKQELGRALPALNLTDD